LIKVEKIYKRRIPQIVAEQIINLISTGQLKPGDKLPSEKQLEKMFGVSRPSIREALSALQMAEIIDMYHGEGSFVKEIDLNTHIHPLSVSMLIKTGKVYELLETRLLIEPEVAALAAQRAKREDLEELEQILTVMEEKVLAGDLAEEEDSRFHLLVSQASHNTILEDIIKNISPSIQYHQKYTRQYSRMIPGRPLTVLEQHRSIFNAIKRKDSKGAGKYMRIHLEDVKKKCQYIENLLARTGNRDQGGESEIIVFSSKK